MEISDKTFKEEVLESKNPVLVMFWGSWCPVCKRMQPMLEEMREEFEKRNIKVRTINIDRNPRNSAEYKIMGTPTFYIFKNRNPVDMSAGAQTKKQIIELVTRNLEQ